MDQPEKRTIRHISQRNNIPRGLEVLFKKAAIDAGFREQLLDKRSTAAELIGLQLTIDEKNMLDSIPLPQLAGIISKTRVSPRLHGAFMGYAAAIMLVALGIETGCGTAEVPCGGINPDLIHPRNPDYAGPYWTDETGSISVRAGSLSGRISDQTGDPIAEAKISLIGTVVNEIDGSQTQITLKTTTDSNGFYRVSPMPAGVFSIYAVCKNFNSDKRETTIEAGIASSINMSLVALTTIHNKGGSRPQD